MATKKSVSRAGKRRTATLKNDELDSVYLLKLVLYLVLGSFWLRLQHGGSELPIPLGFMIGLLFTAHDRLQIDRKVEYAILLAAMFISFWLPLGLRLAWH